MRARATIGMLIACTGVFALLQTGNVTTLFRTQNTADVFGGVLPFGISAKHVLVRDLTTGEVLLEKDADAAVPIASITKLFTAYSAYVSPFLDVSEIISATDVATEGSAGSLMVGQRYTPRELLFPLLLLSSNDASVAISRMVGVDTIDALIADVGLMHTRIVGSSGLRVENVSTAEDVAKLIVYLREHAPYLLDITRLSTYQGAYGGWENNNPGSVFDGWAGGKQGYLPESGYTFVGVYEREHAYVVVLLGSEDLKGDLDSLLSHLQ